MSKLRADNVLVPRVQVGYGFCFFVVVVAVGVCRYVVSLSLSFVVVCRPTARARIAMKHNVNFISKIAETN